jgi:hypothetical protein
MVQSLLHIGTIAVEVKCSRYLVTVQYVYALHWSGPGSGWLLIPVDGTESRKKCDKLINFIVRVMGWFGFMSFVIVVSQIFWINFLFVMNYYGINLTRRVEKVYFV